MKVTQFTKDALHIRRDMRDMERQGFKLCEQSWELLRGGKRDHTITGVEISADGKHIWFKTEQRA